ncbi:MAG TPA: MarR family transcriptional regulator [Microvirga sp.]|nr:MarR family transcriptional regulator [Microvirga sp.]
MKRQHNHGPKHRAAKGPPFIGALLRLCWQRVREHMHAAIRAAGFTDLQEAHFAVFSYPLPDGVRPSELARQLRMSRQATNYLLGQLEQLGYVERRAAPGSERRRVYLTERGWRVVDAIYASLRELQEQWALEVGQDRFRAFMDVLRQLAAREAQAPD